MKKNSELTSHTSSCITTEAFSSKKPIEWLGSSFKDLMGLSQPKVSEMMRGHFSNLSERKLMDCLTRLGYDIEIKARVRTQPTSGGDKHPQANLTNPHIPNIQPTQQMGGGKQQQQTHVGIDYFINMSKMCRLLTL